MGNKEYEKNISINLIYWGLQHLIWIIDRLGFSYMVDWRNEMNKWQIELEKKYIWVGANQRSWNIEGLEEEKK